MRTGQALFPIGIEPGTPIRPWKELIATGVQTTWFGLTYLEYREKWEKERAAIMIL